jgi:hypothetical protein
MALIAAVLALAGCEHRKQEAPATGRPSATLAATAGYGGQPLLTTRVAPGQSVMRATRGATEVTTGYAGAFIQSMLGRASDKAGRRDWFFFVDGIGPPVGAKQVGVADGDALWWDYRDWGTLPVATAVVGQWPLPFARRGGPPVAADPPLRAVLARAGARLTTGRTSWRVRVGDSAALARRDPAWRRALADPDAAGMTATVAGGRVLALGPGGTAREPVPGGRAVAVAVPSGTSAGDGVLMAVAGLDASSARAAARTIAQDPEVLRLRYAEVFDGAGRPLRAAGRAGP